MSALKRATKVRVFLFLAILCASVFGLLLYLPFGKEGAAWNDLPIFIGVSSSALVLAFIWWTAVGFSLRKALIAWPVLFLPFAAHGLTAIGLLYERFVASRLPQQLTVTSYKEEPIIWPGFDGPVGYRVTFDLDHPTGLDRLINPPEIRMGPPVDIPYASLSATQTSGSGYFKDTHLDKKTGNMALLKTVLFQRHFENPAGRYDIDKWSSHVRFNPLGKTRLTYNLLPGIVDYLRSPDHICLNSRTDGLDICPASIKPETGCASPNTTRLNDPVYADGTDLTALWLAPPGVDMGPALTAALRTTSQLQSRPADWQAMHQRLLPAGLKHAGYRLCEPGTVSHTAFRVCFCRMPQAQDKSIIKDRPAPEL
ncbi:MAG: hypothetical protein ACR2OM_14760 [Aestuariivirgaceae bacterium]